MTRDQLINGLRVRQGWVPGKRIRIDLGADGALLLDGVAGAVSEEEDGAADTVIAIGLSDLGALYRRELDPMSAMMQGRLRIEGDMSAAMALQGILSNLGA
jgi:putative sterol carrier protein